ncbi:hypothetical protein DFJ77DRAFT_549976 [Powellomyces hirtus]|nr:hypothetical protein DFJ77DRAFT_549976 [Powellomyces hirtus]
MKSMREKLQAKIAGLEQEVKDLGGEAASAGQVEDLKAEIAKQKQELASNAARIKELEAELREAQAVVQAPSTDGPPEKGKTRAKLEKQLAALRSEVAKLKADAEAAPASDDQEAVAKLAVVTAQLEAANKRVRELETSLKAVSAQRDAETTIDLEAAKTRSKELRGLLDSEIEKRSRLETEVSTLQGRVAELELSITEAKETENVAHRLVEVEEQLASELAKNEASDVALKASEEEKAAALQSLRQLKEDLAAKEASWAEEHGSAATALGDSSSWIAELEKIADAAKKEKANTAQRTRQLLDEKKDLTKSLADAEQRVADAEAKITDSEQRLANARQELEQVQQDLSAEQAARGALKSELDAATQKHQTALASVTSLTERLPELEDSASLVQELRVEQAALKEQFQTASASLAKLEETEARAEQLNRDMKALTGVRRQLEALRTELEQKVSSMEEQLALAKQAVHERDGTSKARILKLEADAKLKDEASAKLSDELKALAEARGKDAREKEQRLASVTRQIEDMQVRLRRQQEAGTDLERQRHEFSLEKQKVQHRLEELELAEQSVRAERDAAWEELEARQSELDGVRSLLEAREAQINGEAGRWADVEDHMANMEVELDTSKRLFQTKSTENDQLRLRVSELEAQVYEATQAAARADGDVDQLRRDARDARREVAERTKDIKRLEKELQALEKERDDSVHALEVLRTQQEQSASEHAELVRKAAEAAERDAERQARIAELSAAIEALEAERESAKKDGELALFSRDKILEDMRIREAQLKNLNKTLKDEVRKLNRASSISSGIGNPTTPTSTSLQSPPPISRPPSTSSISRHSHHGSLGSLASDDSFSRRDSFGGASATAARPAFPTRMSSTVAPVDAPPTPG